jgi:hypothetical protein
VNAARMQSLGLDGMRYLGADPARRADMTERIVMRLVYEQMGHDIEHAAK